MDTPEGMEAIVAGMQEAFVEDSKNGATVLPPPPQSDPEDSADAATEASADSESEAGQPATKPDPYADLKEFGTPEEIRSRLEEVKHAKAMRREANQRYEGASKKEADLAELMRRVESTYNTNQQMLHAAAKLAKNGDMTLASQLWDMAVAQGEEVPETANGFAAAPGRSDPRLAELAKKNAELEQRLNQYAFGDGHSRLTEDALIAIARSPVFQNKTLQKMGVPEKAVERAVEAVIARAQADPSAINIFDPKSRKAAVLAELQKEASYWEQLQSGVVNDYRAERKAKNSQAPPAVRGSTASVRGAPSAPSPLRANPSTEELIEHTAKELLSTMRTSPRLET